MLTFSIACIKFVLFCISRQDNWILVVMIILKEAYKVVLLS